MWNTDESINQCWFQNDLNRNKMLCSRISRISHLKRSRMQMSSCCGKALGKIRGVHSNCNHQNFSREPEKVPEVHVSLFCLWWEWWASLSRTPKGQSTSRAFQNPSSRHHPPSLWELCQNQNGRKRELQRVWETEREQIPAFVLFKITHFLYCLQ